eukprot:XP_014037333.1 PREDICTED: protein-cysteine N-palmitoyltransferase HHAT-like protein [Salmo salar]
MTEREKSSSVYTAAPGATVFSKLDLWNTYHLVRIREGDEWKTAFNAASGHNEYLALVNDVLRDMLNLFVFVYIDDILVFSRSLQEHVLHIRQVLQHLLENQLFVKAEKCEIHRFTIPFLVCVCVSLLQANKDDLTRKEGAIWNISLQGLVHLGAILTVDILFHFLYILSIPTDMKLLKHMSDWAVVGLAYCNLVYDWVKAAVLFGVINTVSRLDRLDPPQPPKCITMLYVFSETHFDRGINDWLCKYVYNYLGGKHDTVWDEAIATLCTFGITVLWLGPCQVVFIWAFFNCFGLNFELWTSKFVCMEPFASLEMAMSPAMSRRIRAVFNTFNFWTIVLYNVIALNSLEFTKLVAKRLLLKGFPITTITVFIVTYCLVQLIKERERRQALIDDPDPVPPPAPAPPPAPPPAPTTVTSTAPTQPVVDPSKEKAE